MKNSEKNFPVWMYFLIAFIEGGSVMAVELLGAKIVAPFFGTSLYVWASVLGVTLCGLAAGYFLGGYLIDKYPKRTMLFRILIVGALFIALMPFLGASIMKILLGVIDIRSGALISCLFFMFLPLACMGMVSPIIIRLATRDIHQSGRTAGSVYAVSTAGGILMTFVMGFYLIPEFGVKPSVLFTAILLGMIPLFYHIFSANYGMAFLILVVGTLFYKGYNPEVKQQLNPNPSAVKLVYRSDGLLGQITVTDKLLQPHTHSHDEKTETSQINRVLMVNWIGQTNYDRGSQTSTWKYVHTMSTFASVMPPGSKALVLGLAGGTVAGELIRLGFEVDVCELDARMEKVARNYFDLNPNVNVLIDDARHYIKTAKKKYDLIVSDLYNGENPPSHVLTTEGLREMKNILSTNGLIIINDEGFYYGKRGRAWRSLYLSFREIGFVAKVFSEFQQTKGGDYSDMIFVASRNLPDFSNPQLYRQSACCQYRKVPVPMSFLSFEDVNFSRDLPLTDDKGDIELIEAASIESWRISWFINNYLNHLKEAEIPIL